MSHIDGVRLSTGDDLGCTGKCNVEETPKGCFISYTDRHSEAFYKEKLKNKRIKADMDMAEEEEQERDIRKQIGRTKQLMPNGLTSLKRLSRQRNLSSRAMLRLVLCLDHRQKWY